MDPITAISAGTSILGSILGAVGAGKRLRQAQTAQDLASANALALGRNVFDFQRQQMAPFQAGGVPAAAQINALLGIGGGMAPLMQSAASAAPQPGYTDAEALAFLRSIADGKTGKRIRRASTLQQALAFADAGERARFDAWTQARTPLAGADQPAPGLAVAAGIDQGSAEDAFGRFREGTGYQFRFNEGMNALMQPFFRAGVGQSGAAQKAAMRFGQGMASDEFARYLQALQNQQMMGLNAAQGIGNAAGNFGQAGQNIALAQGQQAGGLALARGANMQNAIGGAVYGVNQLLGSSFPGRSQLPMSGAGNIVQSRNVPLPVLQWGG